MNLGIMTSSLDTLNLESKITFATALLTTLRDKDYNIVMGSGTKGLMGTVKEIAKENGSILTVVGYDDLELNKNDASVKIKVESLKIRFIFISFEKRFTFRNFGCILRA